ncbi:unnamed protein product [Chrysoparadoxa australica]
MAAERLVICLDVGKEMAAPWEVEGGNDVTRLKVVCVALVNLVKLKLGMNAKHQFAVCLFADSAVWLQDYTSNLHVLQDVLLGAQVHDSGDEGELGSLFSTLEEHLSELASELVRVVVVYGRAAPVAASSVMTVTELLQRPRFYLDWLCIRGQDGQVGQGYEVSSEDQETGDSLRGMKNTYYMEQQHSSGDLQTNIGLLLAHPEQRSSQAHAEKLMTQPSIRDTS